MPVAGSKRRRRTSPESTTTRTPGMVRLVSAMLVASTTRRASVDPCRAPGLAGLSAASCSSLDSSPYSGGIRTGPVMPDAGGDPSSSARTRWISRAPGRNTSTSPGSSSNARRTILAVSASGDSCDPREAPICGSGGNPLPAYRVATGKDLPCAVMTGASPSKRDTAAPSRVADMIRILRSGVTLARASRVSARPRSACRLRSWYSSKRTAAKPSSAGSDCSIRVSTPSVTTSMRVFRDTLVSRRIRYPTVLPTASPSVCAIRRATARAASRRGSSIRMRLPAAHGSWSNTNGTTVLFPAPGGAVSTADTCS